MPQDKSNSKLSIKIKTCLNVFMNCFQNINRELSMYFAQMCRYIDITRDEYFSDMKKHEKDIKVLGSVLNHSKILRYYSN